MMTLYTATRRHVIKLISCNKFVFKEKNENILTMKKDRSTVHKKTFVYRIYLY